MRYPEYINKWLGNIRTSAREMFVDVAPHRFFAFTAAVFGLAFLLITPPFQTPDEPVHFYRAYQISQGNLTVDTKGSVAGGELPSSLGDSIIYTTTPDLRFRPDLKYNLHKTKGALSIKENPTKKRFYDFAATASYSPISYLPQSMGILFARIVHGPPLVMMYAGRLANLTAWIVMIATAIRLMSSRKWVLAFVALLPMALFDAVSLGADVMFYGLFAICLALILRLRTDKRMLDNKMTLFLAVLFTAMVLTKQVAFIFLLLIFLLPRSILGDGKVGQLRRIALLCLPLVVFAAWMLIAGQSNAQTVSDFGASPAKQVDFIINRPLGYALVLFQTYFFTPGDGIVRSFIGTFGWMDAPLSELLASIGYVGLAFMLCVNYIKPRSTLSPRERLIVLGALILYWGAVTTALYVYYDPVKYRTLIGLQGRYFIPLALLAIPLLNGNYLRTSKKLYQRVAIFLPIFLLSASFITLFYRYFVHNA